MVETILSSPLVFEIILPFLLVFTVVFAILQKTRILGEGKKQIDAIVALVVGLIVVSYGYATNIITSLVPFLAVSAIVILIFLLLSGMVFKEGEFYTKIHQRVNITIGVLAAIGVIIATLVATGGWNYLINRFYGDQSAIFSNVLFIVVIIAAVLVVGMGKSGDKKEEKK
jgi:hypothetical protein